jgi:hypothetical protein
METLSKKGTLLNKSKNRKLDYEQNGSNYEIEIYELSEQKKEGKVTQRSFKRMNNFKVVMSEKALLNYLYSELYIENQINK